MPRPSPIPSGRVFLVLALLALALLSAYDLTSPGSVLHAFWDYVAAGTAPVEGVRDEVVDGLGIPR